VTGSTLEVAAAFAERHTTAGEDSLAFSEQTSGWAPEEAVLTTPEVQEALTQAIAEFEAWKNSL
jgi:hypothetical protein